MDHMLFIPKKCIKYLSLKNCAYYELYNILRYLSSKYLMRRSVSGWMMYDYLKSSMKDLFS